MLENLISLGKQRSGYNHETITNISTMTHEKGKSRTLEINWTQERKNYKWINTRPSNKVLALLWMNTGPSNKVLTVHDK